MGHQCIRIRPFTKLQVDNKAAPKALLFINQHIITDLPDFNSPYNGELENAGVQEWPYKLVSDLCHIDGTFMRK